MRKLTGVTAALAVAVTLALPAYAGAAPHVSHRDGPHGCSKNAADPSHRNGPGCAKHRGRRNLSHQGRNASGGNNNEDRAQRNCRSCRGGD